MVPAGSGMTGALEEAAGGAIQPWRQGGNRLKGQSGQNRLDKIADDVVAILNNGQNPVTPVTPALTPARCAGHNARTSRADHE